MCGLRADRRLVLPLDALTHTRIALVGEVVGLDRLVVAMWYSKDVKNNGEGCCNERVDGERRQRDVAHLADDGDERQRSCKMVPGDRIHYVVRRIRAVKHAAGPSRKQSPTVEPSRIQAEDDRGKCLKNPDDAEQL